MPSSKGSEAISILLPRHLATVFSNLNHLNAKHILYFTSHIENTTSPRFHLEGGTFSGCCKLSGHDERNSKSITSSYFSNSVRYEERNFNVGVENQEDDHQAKPPRRGGHTTKRVLFDLSGVLTEIRKSTSIIRFSLVNETLFFTHLLHVRRWTLTLYLCKTAHAYTNKHTINTSLRS